ncbi:hypothetical protein [Sandarakinorhabdus sp.]|uniref:hypothetical protein n=1 Tax=Sandarakinorhabdus sp. TaxID=1916663 RepID=UPI00286E29D5|nr:hypothetical protein [Sandarakinorhabdus sp.]
MSFVEGWPSAGPGWQQVPAGPGWPGNIDADLLLLPADGSAAITRAEVERLAVPVVVAARDDDVMDPELADFADAFVFPEDAADVLGEIAARLTGFAAPGVADFSGAAQHISALSAEAARIAAALAQLASEADNPVADAAIGAPLVRRMIRLRRDRDRHFPGEIFADPAWDMLLDLIAAQLEGTNVPVSSLCIAAAVPTTTALRWIRSLSEAGMLGRRTDPSDARRTYISLSPVASDAMLAYLRRFNSTFQLR